MDSLYRRSESGEELGGPPITVCGESEVYSSLRDLMPIGADVALIEPVVWSAREEGRDEA